MAMLLLSLFEAMDVDDCGVHVPHVDYLAHTTKIRIMRFCNGILEEIVIYLVRSEYVRLRLGGSDKLGGKACMFSKLFVFLSIFSKSITSREDGGKTQIKDGKKRTCDANCSDVEIRMAES